MKKSQKSNLYEFETGTNREVRRRFLMRFLLILMLVAACIIGVSLAHVWLNSPAPNV
jgi:hypothetical protein